MTGQCRLWHQDFPPPPPPLCLSILALFWPITYIFPLSRNWFLFSTYTIDGIDGTDATLRSAFLPYCYIVWSNTIDAKLEVEKVPFKLQSWVFEYLLQFFIIISLPTYCIHDLYFFFYNLSLITNMRMTNKRNHGTGPKVRIMATKKNPTHLFFIYMSPLTWTRNQDMSTEAQGLPE